MTRARRIALHALHWQVYGGTYVYAYAVNWLLANCIAVGVAQPFHCGLGIIIGPSMPRVCTMSLPTLQRGPSVLLSA